MKRICWAVVAGLLLGGCGEITQFEKASGARVALSEFYGRPLLISYYAPWCAPCQSELPLLQEMVTRRGLQVLLVSYDATSQEELGRQGAPLAPELPLLRALPNARLPYPKPRALPTSYLLDASGQLKETITGELSARKVDELVTTMLTPLPRPEPWMIYSSKQ
ncbi:TlpA family protein disulfide reductase [Aeromonas schubertii]|uniref:TlpA family protein disulfide reductase n=1 Tax=Aeromonas schubertii TaxID=652 RepID=UPI0009E396DB|nr:thioredoxin domain-containing protein [Aeromonas schubertii]